MPRDIKGKAKGDETMSAVNMTDMRRTNAAKKDVAVNAATNSDGPEYPYGLKVHLDHNSMKKMGMKDMPGVGSEVMMHSKAHVVGARAEKREGRDEERHVELQITHLGVHPKTDGMKSQDQAGSGKTPDAGKVTEKKGAKPGYTKPEPAYGRKRH